MIPVIVLSLAILSAISLADVYGVAIASGGLTRELICSHHSVGMLSTIGLTLGVDAYGPSMPDLRFTI